MHLIARIFIAAAAAALSVAFLIGYIHIPDVVWAALIAAGVAFFTTTLSNRNSRRQLGMQLDSDALQQKLEREMALKREVYLPATEAVVRSQSALARLIDFNTDYVEISRQMTADLAILAKVHLVGSQLTVRALMNFSRELSPAYAEMLILRSPLIIRKRAIDLEQTYLDAAIAEHTRFVQMMKAHNLSGNADQTVMNRLDAQCANELKTHALHSKKQAALWKEQRVEQLALIERYSQLFDTIMPLVPEAILAARRDLQLTLDENEYRQMAAQQQQAARVLIAQLVEKTRAEVSNSA
jgi:hypothetical protein